MKIKIEVGERKLIPGTLEYVKNDLLHSIYRIDTITSSNSNMDIPVLVKQNASTTNIIVIAGSRKGYEEFEYNYHGYYTIKPVWENKGLYGFLSNSAEKYVKNFLLEMSKKFEEIMNQEENEVVI